MKVTLLICVLSLFGHINHISAQSQYDQIINDARNLIDAKRFNEAVTVLQKAHALDQKRIESYYYSGLALSNICFEGGTLCKEAVTMLNVSISIDSTYMHALYNRGVCFSRVGILEQALIDFDNALKLNENDPDIYVNRSSVYYRMEKYEEACRDLDTAIALGSKQGANLKETLCK